MKLEHLTWLADESIADDVIAHLRARGWDIQGAREQGLGGQPDDIVLTNAHAGGRAVITHDGDFGTLAVVAGQPCIGILRIRPGHIDSSHTIATLELLIRQGLEVSPPFLVVSHRRDQTVTIRVRRL